MSAAVEWQADHQSLTPEQLYAVQRRDGELFLAAGAGSGKTSVLVERFARCVLEDGIDVGAILTITFTDKAAAEMRERIRARLRELGEVEAARAAEGAFISTIHGFCARVLRAHALAAGIDPAFRVLDEVRAGTLAHAASEEALEQLAQGADGAELIGSYGVRDLRLTVRALYDQLRSQAQLHPRLPAVAPGADCAPAAGRLHAAAVRVAAELGGVEDPSPRVLEALASVERAVELGVGSSGWPGDLDALALPGGNGAALRTEACLEYTEALTSLRDCWAQHWAARVAPALGRLLDRFGLLYEGRKRDRSGLDFADLELLCTQLLRSEPQLREHYQSRFARVMVDELQDTNAVQLELIDLISSGNVFTVGDAQQSIYGFRHADVTLFEERGRRLADSGDSATLETNFRSRPEILEVINRAFAGELGEGFTPLAAGRAEPPSGESLVELLLVDRSTEEGEDVASSSARLAEADMLARRIDLLLCAGTAARDVVVLTRATTDITVYERALEKRGVPTYVIGGRGYWSHPQVIDVLSYLRVLANPRDEEALYTVLVSPMVGACYDALVILAAAARSSGRDPWWILRDPGSELDALEDAERQRLVGFGAWAAGERIAAARSGVQELIERGLERTGYDLAVLSMPGGRRRLANVRKLMRLGREHDASQGPELRGFLDEVRQRERSVWRTEESEAPVEGEALDAVRLMTIHRAKGLEFDVVCVADLGRAPWRETPVARVGGDGRLGLRLARPGTGARVPALAYEALGGQARELQAREERRLFYVAATRARERLIFSGIAKVKDTWEGRGGAAPIGWLGPALVPELPAREGVVDGVRVEVVAGLEGAPAEVPAALPGASVGEADWARVDPPAAPSGPPVRSLSYSSLALYKRCGYRYYVERVLGLPPIEPAPSEGGRGGLSGAERGAAVHALLERLDFRRPVLPMAEAVRLASGPAATPRDREEILELLERFTTGELCGRLGRARKVRREQPFAFLLGGTMLVGVLDVIGIEPGGRALVVDYKTDRLEGADPRQAVTARYRTQQLIYALATLRDGAEQVEVVHMFLERLDAPVTARFTSDERGALEAELEALVTGVRVGRFEVTDAPHRELCSGCPAEGGLCSWGLEMTRRESPERLF